MRSAKSNRAVRLAVVLVSLSTAFVSLAYASTAAASTQFRAAQYPAQVSATQGEATVASFSGSEGPVTLDCSSAQFSGAMNGAESTLALGAEYAEGKKGCPLYLGSALFGKATIHMHGCYYELQAQFVSHYEGLLGVTCDEEGEAIEVAAPLGCKIFIPEQVPASGINYTNQDEGYTGYVSLEGAGEGIEYTSNGCSSLVQQTGYDGELNLPNSLRALDEKGANVGLQLTGPERRFYSASKSGLTSFEGVNAGSTWWGFSGTNDGVECGGSSYAKGTADTGFVGVAEATLYPVYNDEKGSCISNELGHHTKVTTEGCSYVLHGGEGKDEPFEGRFDIDCSPGHTIQFSLETGLPCEISIGSQSDLTGISYSNHSPETGWSKEYISTDFSIIGIHYTATGNWCPSGVDEHGTNGTLSAEMSLRGIDANSDEPTALRME